MKRFSLTRGRKGIPGQPTLWKQAGWLGRSLSILLVIAALVLLPASGVAIAAPDSLFPDVIPLPNGFNPEGIAIGRAHTFYVGSIPSGAVFQGDLLTGEGGILVPAHPGRNSVGLGYDVRTNWIYVAGGSTGAGYIYDAGTGGDVADFQFTTQTSFVNDVDIARDGAFFTDSSQPFLYEVPLESGGKLPAGGQFREIPLGGDFTFVPGALNANGIVATPGGHWLIIVHTALGILYRVNPDTGEATLINLGRDSVPNGDGLLLHGQTLYVVQNFKNQISVINLNPDFTSGEVVDIIKSPNFHIPTTLDEFFNSLYVVNAHFGENTSSFEVVRVPKR